MRTCRIERGVALVGLLGGLLAAAPAGLHAEEEEAPREVPKALVPVINAGQRALEAGDPQAALRILESYEGEPDPLQQILIGYAHLEQDEGREAEAAFRRATELDPELKQARMGLARSQAAQEDWEGVLKTLRGEVALDDSDAGLLGLYGRAAFESGDLRLAAVVSERGVVRFPDDIPLRRLDVAVLLQREDWEEAAQAALGLLSQRPNDPLLWRQLAAALERSDATLSTAALEAASMVADTDQLRTTHAARLVQEDAPDAALRVLEKLEDAPTKLRWAAAAGAEKWAEAPSSPGSDANPAQTALRAWSSDEEDSLRMLREAVQGGRVGQRVLWLFAQAALEQGRLVNEGRRALARLASSCQPYGARAAELLAAREQGVASLWLKRCSEDR